jgi:hypothetical protein
VLGIRALGPDPDRRPLLGGQHHDPHDALAVDLDPVAAHVHLAGEPRGAADEVGRRTRVHPEPVTDPDLDFVAFWNHGDIPALS